MADRTVLVRLKADIAQYQAGLQRAKQSTQEFGREVSGQGKTASQDVERVGRSALVVGGVMAIGFGKAIQVGMRFEKQMSGVQAVSGATSAEMHKLSDAAIAAGASQQLAGVTASDAAAAEAELVKAGVSVADVLGGALMGSLTLASAGQIAFADAATIAAQAMNIFDLGGRDVTHIADVLAAAANKSAADVGGLGDALRQGGLVASQTGLTFEETVATLAAFADNALIGSDAGTSLKTMLQRLTPISAEAEKLMEELGFSAYDAAGNFIGLEGLADELQTSLGGMTNEQRNLTLATLFGSDAIRGANVLYEEGAVGMRGFMEAVNDEGAAARMAAIQNDNLAGDIETLGGAFESALIENGSQANEVLRTLVQTTTGLVTGFSSLPGLMQSGALGLGAVAATGTLAVGVVGTMYPKAIAAQKALRGMGDSGAFLANHMKTLAGTVAVAGAGFAVFALWEGAMAAARAEGEKLSSAWEPTAFQSAEVGLDAFKNKLSDVNFEWARMSDQATSSKAPWDADKRAQLEAGIKVLEGTSVEMTRITDLSDDLALALGISGDAAIDFVMAQRDAGFDVLGGDYEAIRDVLGGVGIAMRTGTGDTQVLAAATGVLNTELVTAEDKTKAFNEALDALFNQMFGAEAAADAFQSGLNELPAVLMTAAAEGLNLNDVLTSFSAPAITVREHMRGMVQDATDLIAEWQEQGVTGDELTARMGMLSASFRQQAIDAGLPGPVVDHYLGLLGLIPIEKNTDVNADTPDGQVDAYGRRIAGIPGQKTTHLVVTGFERAMQQVNAIRYASGDSTVRFNYARDVQGWGGGGVTSYATGGIDAHVTAGEMIRYGEPETGGEAFIPRLGNASRSRQILEVAAGWYGMDVVDGGRPRAMFTGGVTSSATGGGSRGGGSVYSPTFNLNIYQQPNQDSRALTRTVVDAIILADRRGITRAA